VHMDRERSGRGGRGRRKNLTQTPGIPQP